MSDQLIFKRLSRNVLIFFSRSAKLKFRQEEKNCILIKFYIITELFVIWHAQSTYTALGKLGEQARKRCSWSRLEARQTLTLS
jgi:hypothetical protein